MVYFYKHKYLESLSLDVNNLGLLRGYSAFEYLRTYNLRPFCLEGHLIRFLFSIQKMGLSCPYTLEELKNITHQLISYEGHDCGIKWYACAGSSVDGLRHSASAEVFAFTTSLASSNPLYFTEGVLCRTIQEKRPLAEAKTTAYLEAVRQLSYDPSIQEVIYVDAHGHMLEAATSNLFFVKNGTLYTASDDVLYGLTREVVLDITKQKYPVIFKKVALHEMADYQEAFLTASNKEVMPIKKINDHSFLSKEITCQIMRDFKDFIEKGEDNHIVPSVYQNELLLKS